MNYSVMIMKYYEFFFKFTEHTIWQWMIILLYNLVDNLVLFYIFNIIWNEV